MNDRAMNRTMFLPILLGTVREGRQMARTLALGRENIPSQYHTRPATHVAKS